MPKVAIPASDGSLLRRLGLVTRRSYFLSEGSAQKPAFRQTSPKSLAHSFTGGFGYSATFGGALAKFLW